MTVLILAITTLLLHGSSAFLLPTWHWRNRGSQQLIHTAKALDTKNEISVYDLNGVHSVLERGIGHPASPAMVMSEESTIGGEFIEFLARKGISQHRYRQMADEIQFKWGELFEKSIIGNFSNVYRYIRVRSLFWRINVNVIVFLSTRF